MNERDGNFEHEGIGGTLSTRIIHGHVQSENESWPIEFQCLGARRSRRRRRRSFVGSPAFPSRPLSPCELGGAGFAPSCRRGSLEAAASVVVVVVGLSVVGAGFAPCRWAFSLAGSARGGWVAVVRCSPGSLGPALPPPLPWLSSPFGRAPVEPSPSSCRCRRRSSRRPSTPRTPPTRTSRPAFFFSSTPRRRLLNFTIKIK